MRCHTLCVYALSFAWKMGSEKVIMASCIVFSSFLVFSFPRQFLRGRMFESVGPCTDCSSIFV